MIRLVIKIHFSAWIPWETTIMTNFVRNVKFVVDLPREKTNQSLKIDCQLSAGGVLLMKGGLQRVATTHKVIGQILHVPQLYELFHSCDLMVNLTVPHNKLMVKSFQIPKGKWKCLDYGVNFGRAYFGLLLRLGHFVHIIDWKCNNLGQIIEWLKFNIKTLFDKCIIYSFHSFYSSLGIHIIFIRFSFLKRELVKKT